MAHMMVGCDGIVPKAEKCKVTAILSQDRDSTRMLCSIFLLRYPAVLSRISGWKHRVLTMVAQALLP